MATGVEIIQQAQTALAQNDVELARLLLKQVIQLEPNNESALLLYSDIAERSEYAVACLQKVLELNPSNESAWNKLNLLRNRSGAMSVETLPPPLPREPVPVPHQSSPVIQSSPVNLVKCPRCGGQNLPETKQCYSCGENLKKEGITMTVNPPNQPSRPSRVTIVDFDMPFWSLTMFLVKIALASIPAAIIIAVIWSVILFVMFFVLSLLGVTLSALQSAIR